MDTEVAALKNKKVFFFHGNLSVAAGSQKIMVEEVKYFESLGARTYVLTCNFRKEALFNETLKAEIQVIGGDESSGSIMARIVGFSRLIRALRKRIKEIRPAVIIARNPWECMHIYLATLFTPFPYVSHIHETLLWSNGGVREKALIYRRAVNRISQSPAHREFTPTRLAKASPAKRIAAELASLVEYLAVRKAKKTFVPSNQMKWEVSELYGRESVVLKGAFPSRILSYRPKVDIKDRLGLSGKKMLFSLSMLTERKRVSLLIRAFRQICEQFTDVVLVVGGTGPEEDNLKRLVHELKIEDRVKFAGFIPEEVLWDYYAGCAVFAHPDRAEFDITPYVALALQKKVVWTTTMEIDEFMAENRHIFVAEPTVSGFAPAL